MLKIEYMHFPTRDIRTQYVANHYLDLIKGRVLDVGCDQCTLKSLVEGIDYTGMDISGTPDIYQNLDEQPRLPFENDTFDCVLCADVLEHLDNLHLVFDELVRVTRGFLIISLPNCWNGARQCIGRGRGSFAHYGLPFEKPIDRHKWFFSLTEARNFVVFQAEKHKLSLIDLHATEKPRPAIVRLIRKIRYNNLEYYANRYAHTLWIVFAKKIY